MVCSIYKPIFSRLETKILEKMAKIPKNGQKWPIIFFKYFKFFFGQKWSNKRCSYWSELTPCQISKKSEKIFRGMPAQACLGAFWAQKLTLTDFCSKTVIFRNR